MTINNKIWYDLVHTKFGDEYLILYLRRQRTYRKWFKVLTLLFSASGIFSAFQLAQIPTIISCALIGLVQLATSIENFIIHSEDDLDNLSKLRMLYYERLIRLEELYHSYLNDKILDQEASEEFFNLRKSGKDIEEMDNKLNVRKFNKLTKIADITTNNYLKTYYYE
ncbi:hypothetical protein [Flavobacterium sp.]|uniref:hypothetical protein n=1 Tax=Flavobacterium sp. TaxID=239 RepID=UPI00286C6679|nr:hypothetical protein [Flavobacterium sp.]